MLDRVLLGLLTERPQSAYDLARQLEDLAPLGLSASQGSVHPALQKLLQLGLLTQTVEQGGARVRKTYELTGTGRAEFLAWLRSPIPLPKARDEAVVRWLFRRFLSEREAAQLLADYTARLEAALEEVSALRKQKKAAFGALSSEEQGPARDEAHALSWQKGYYKFLLKWHRREAKRSSRSP